MQFSRPLLAWCALLVAPLLAANPAEDAYSDDSWLSPSEVRITAADLAFSEESYPLMKNEGVYFMSRFNNGWVLAANLFRFNHVLFNRWGLYVVVAEPDGTGHWTTFDIESRDLISDPERLFVTDGVNTVEGGPEECRLRLDLDGVGCDLVFEGILNAWQPGDGIYRLSGDGRAFEQRIVASPWAIVRGWVEVADRRMDAVGQGYVEKSLIVNSFRRLNPILYSMRVYDRETVPSEERWHVGLLDTTSHRKHGSRRLPRLIVARGDEWILATTDYEVEPLRSIEGVDLPYTFPVELRLVARSKGYSLVGEYTAETLFDVTDVIDEVPRWLRGIVLLFVKRPVFFRFLGRFDGVVTAPDGTRHTLELYGPYEYVVVR